jgi:molybdopterin/thiamine biosynthesis adenylyltransferase
VSLAKKRALLVGVGGLGSPAAIVLASAGVGTVGMADDDTVDVTNLHRQILFTDDDVGAHKLTAAAAGLRRWVPGGGYDVALHHGRILPHNAREMVRGYDVVVEGSDNFATKFMVADACALERVPVVHGSAVRWHGTAFAVGARGQPCYRCLFEDIPREHAPNCAEAGVLGPAVGIVAALMCDLALHLLAEIDVAGTLVTYDGKTGAHRRRKAARRVSCDLCSLGRIERVDAHRYASAPDALCALD